MENVFITRSTYNSIVGQIDIEKLPKELLSNKIYDELEIDYLYKKQTNQILAYKFIAENPEQLSFYQKIKSIPNDDNFLIKTSGPKYHLYSDCENINSRFENMLIPKEIKDKGPEIVNKFRDYLLNEFGKFSPKRYNELKDLILTKVNSQFNVTLHPHNISIFDEDNSGQQLAQNLSLPELKINIQNFANEYKRLCETYPDIFPKYTLKAFLAKTPEKITFIPLDYFKNNRKEEFCKILIDFLVNTQLPTYETLKQYYMVLFNPELKFEGQLMSQIGLNACTKCSMKLNSLN